MAETVNGGTDPASTAADPQTGQAPAASPTNPPATAATGQAPALPTADEWRELQAWKKKAESELTEARGDAAKYRKLMQDQETAKLSDLERAAKERDEAKGEAQALRDRLTSSEVRMAASALGFQDPGDALAMLDREKLKLDAAGLPTNAEELLKALADAKPYLLKPATPQQRQAPSAGAAMAPARSSVQGASEPQLGRHTRLGNLGVFQK